MKNVRLLACKFDLVQNERKCAQVLAKRSRKSTQVDNLQLLAFLFGQGFSVLSARDSKIRKRRNEGDGSVNPARFRGPRILPLHANETASYAGYKEFGL